MTTLSWIKCTDDAWCPFETLNLDSFDDVTGVYIIWHRDEMNPRTVRVGQGDIKDRIRAHREDPEILAYRQHGLSVTWASVQAQHLDGVERYLADMWAPLVGERFPAVPPIEVNSPFG